VLPAIGVFPPWGESMVGFDRALLLATVYRSVYGVAASFITARLAARSAHAARLGVWLRGPCREHHGRRRDVEQGTGLRAHWYPLALIVLAMPTAWAGGKLRVMQHDAGTD